MKDIKLRIKSVENTMQILSLIHISGRGASDSGRMSCAPTMPIGHAGVSERQEGISSEFGPSFICHLIQSPEKIQDFFIKSPFLSLRFPVY